MAKFVQGQVISTITLNEIDTIIQSLKKEATVNKLKELFTLWDNLPANNVDTNISDEIHAIQDKINNYITK